mmetsp:Transcript_17588/g.19590  ORF Transcript_17588/g.19590 Transcript_17588/m.19590 type:complete len:89 (-) Transcript_17588:207-473(-)
MNMPENAFMINMTAELSKIPTQTSSVSALVVLSIAIKATLGSFQGHFCGMNAVSGLLSDVKTTINIKDMIVKKPSHTENQSSVIFGPA